MSRLNLFFFLFFVGLLIWISFFQAEKVSRIQKGTLSLFSPFIKASGRLSESTGTLETERLSYSELEDALARTTRERDSLRLEVLQLDEVLLENEELRRALQYKTRSPLRLLPTRVINRKPLTWYNTVVIDKGSKDQIRPDLPVIIPVGNAAALVGKVSEVVGEDSAVVLLLTDEMCQVPVQIKGRDEQGILSVNGSRSPVTNKPLLRVRYLVKEAVVYPGDEIITSGIGEVFRKGLLLGQVRESRRGVIDTEAVVYPAVDFDRLKDVFVVMPDGSNRETQPDPTLSISGQP